jgi:hypothetical protein
VLTFGWGCDYTPELPTPASTPAPTAVPPGGSVPVVVVPLPTQTPVPGVSPVPPGGSNPVASVKIVATVPPPGETITVSGDASVRTRRPIIDFEFTSPRSLTLDNAHTNIQLVLFSRAGCLTTDLGYATRLDRADTVYVANSVARFRTGNWLWRISPNRCGGSSFSTQFVFYAVGENDPDRAYDGYVETGWSFVVR